MEGQCVIDRVSILRAIPPTRAADGTISYKAVVIAAVVTIEIAEADYLTLNDMLAHDRSHGLIEAIERAADHAVAERLPDRGIVRIAPAHLGIEYQR